MKPISPFLALFFLLLAGCDNMKDQPTHRPLEPELRRSDGSALIRPAVHTVARGDPAPGDPWVTGFRNGAPVTQSPVGFTPDVLARGRERFEIYCAVCHGGDGYATGIVVRRGFPAPPSYHDDRLRSTPDGHLFDVITRGYGVMLPFADRITPADRWAIVGYIRALQRSQHATLADVPDPARLELVR
jgi:mono/diheme cytochrome c family protein